MSVTKEYLALVFKESKMTQIENYNLEFGFESKN